MALPRSIPVPAVVVLVALLAAGCAVPDRSAAGAPALIYVANSLDGTVTRIDAQVGNVVGTALAVGQSPLQLVAASDGSLLVLSEDTSRRGALTHVARAGAGRDRWTVRTVPLDPPSPQVSTMLLAGDGERYAVVVYAEPGTDSPRLALVDVRAGKVERNHRLPASGLSARSVALERGSAGPIAYVGLWRRAPNDDAGPSAAGGRIVAVNADSGAVLGAVPVAGAPALLLHAPDPGGAGRRLYAVHEIPGSTRGGGSDARAAPASAELLVLHPSTLDIQRSNALDRPLMAMAPSPDGGQLYALADRRAADPGRAATTLVRVELDSGTIRSLAELPGIALGIAVTRERVYAPNAFGAELWAIERRTGRLLQTIPVGSHPVALAAAGAGVLVGNVS